MHSGNKNIRILSFSILFLNYNRNNLMFVKLLNLLRQFGWIYTFSLWVQTALIFSASNHDDSKSVLYAKSR